MGRILLALSLALSCGVLVHAEGNADDKKNLFAEYMQKYGRPGPEHKLLEPLVGTWNSKCKMWLDPAATPQVSEGTLVRKSILGGRFICEEFDGKMMDKPFQGFGTMGYDRAKEKFVSTWIDSVSTAIHMSQGSYDATTKTFTFKNEETCPITKKPVKTRDTLKVVSDNEQVMEMYRQMGDEKEMKTMEITLTRKK
jgi:hypothetical protein